MKTLIGFVAGIVLAGGIAFFVVQRKSEAPPQQVSQVTPADSQVPAPAPSQVVETPKPAETPAPAVAPPAKPVERRKPAPKPVVSNPASAATPAPATEPKPAETTVAKNEDQPAPAPAPAAEAPPYREPAPPPPPKPNTVTITQGTAINVRLQEALSSDKNQVGDAFSAVLDRPLVVDGFVIAERGARVEGRVVTSKAAGRVKGTSDIAIELSALHTADGQTVKLVTEPWEKHGDTSTGSDAAKVGAAAGIGAAIGAIAGGGKGAALGAILGGGAGTGGVLATRGKAVKIPVETKIAFMLKEPVTITEKLR